MANSNPRYQAVPNEEDIDTTELNNEVNAALVTGEPTTTASSIELPPPYDPGENCPISLSQSSIESPPLYNDVVKLPTYNESQNVEPQDEEEDRQNFTFYLIPNDANSDTSREALGNDMSFILCFFFTFIFNGIGFIIAYCSTTSISAHYGAISGFGLSLVKWSFLAKHSSYSKDFLESNGWLLYLLVLIGWIMFIRGIYAYAMIKRNVYSRPPIDIPTQEE